MTGTQISACLDKYQNKHLKEYKDRLINKKESKSIDKYKKQVHQHWQVHPSTVTSGATIAPLARLLMLPPHSLHVAPTQAPHSSNQLSRRPPTHPHATSTPSLHCSNATSTQQGGCPHTAATQLQRRHHTALTQLHSALTQPPRCCTPPTCCPQSSSGHSLKGRMQGLFSALATFTGRMNQYDDGLSIGQSNNLMGIK